MRPQKKRNRQPGRKWSHCVAKVGTLTHDNDLIEELKETPRDFSKGRHKTLNDDILSNYELIAKNKKITKAKSEAIYKRMMDYEQTKLDKKKRRIMENMRLEREECTYHPKTNSTKKRLKTNRDGFEDSCDGNSEQVESQDEERDVEQGSGEKRNQELLERVNQIIESKQRKIKDMRFKEVQMRERKLRQECTFTPEINRTYSFKDLFEWQKKNEEKIFQTMLVRRENEQKFSFTPKISQKSRNMMKHLSSTKMNVGDRLYELSKKRRQRQLEQQNVIRRSGSKRFLTMSGIPLAPSRTMTGKPDEESLGPSGDHYMVTSSESERDNNSHDPTDSEDPYYAQEGISRLQRSRKGSLGGSSKSKKSRKFKKGANKRRNSSKKRKRRNKRLPKSISKAGKSELNEVITDGSSNYITSSVFLSAADGASCTQKPKNSKKFAKKGKRQDLGSNPKKPSKIGFKKRRRSSRNLEACRLLTETPKATKTIPKLSENPKSQNQKNHPQRAKIDSNAESSTSAMLSDTLGGIVDEIGLAYQATFEWEKDSNDSPPTPHQRAKNCQIIQKRKKKSERRLPRDFDGPGHNSMCVIESREFLKNEAISKLNQTMVNEDKLRKRHRRKTKGLKKSGAGQRGANGFTRRVTQKNPSSFCRLKKIKKKALAKVFGASGAGLGSGVKVRTKSKPDLGLNEEKDVSTLRASGAPGRRRKSKERLVETKMFANTPINNDKRVPKVQKTDSKQNENQGENGRIEASQLDSVSAGKPQSTVKKGILLNDCGNSSFASRSSKNRFKSSAKKMVMFKDDVITNSTRKEKDFDECSRHVIQSLDRPEIEENGQKVEIAEVRDFNQIALVSPESSVCEEDERSVEYESVKIGQGGALKANFEIPEKGLKSKSEAFEEPDSEIPVSGGESEGLSAPQNCSEGRSGEGSERESFIRERRRQTKDTLEYSQNEDNETETDAATVSDSINQSFLGKKIFMKENAQKADFSVKKAPAEFEVRRFSRRGSSKSIRTPCKQIKDFENLKNRKIPKNSKYTNSDVLEGGKKPGHSKKANMKINSLHIAHKIKESTPDATNRVLRNLDKIKDFDTFIQDLSVIEPAPESFMPKMARQDDGKRYLLINSERVYYHEKVLSDVFDVDLRSRIVI